MNHHKAELKATKGFPPEYHTHFWDRSPQTKQTIKEKVVFPCTLVHERLGRNESKRKSTPVKKRLGQQEEAKVNTSIKERPGHNKKDKALKKRWVYKGKTQLVTKVNDQVLCDKRRHMIWSEEKPTVYARVNMVEVDEEVEMHGFVHTVNKDGEAHMADDEGIEAMMEQDDEGLYSDQENPCFEKSDKEISDGKKKQARLLEDDEKSRLERTIKKQSEDMLKMQKEWKKETSQYSKLIRFL